MKTRNPIARVVTRIRPKVVPDKRKALLELIMTDPDCDIDFPALHKPTLAALLNNPTVLEDE